MELLGKLISIPSYSKNETTIVKFISKELLTHRLKVYCVGDNVLLHIPGNDSSKALIFNAHIDTVHEGDHTQWKHGPFEGASVKDKIYGLGASDEKAAVAAFITLAKGYKQNKPSCDIWMMFVAREELDGSGTEESLKWFMRKNKGKYKSLAGVLGEPTGLMEIEIGHKGNIFLQATTHGDSGHGSNPRAIKKHAVLEMQKVGELFTSIFKTWKTKYHDKVLGSPSIGLFTSIKAGNSINKFPDTCTATFDVRTTPKLHPILLAEVQKRMPHAQWEYAEKPVSFGLTKASEKIVSLTKAITKAKVTTAVWSNDMCFFTEHCIPAIVYGPGEKECIHSPNEYCYISKVCKSIEDYQKIVKAF